MFYVLLLVLMSCGKKESPPPANVGEFEDVPVSFPITPGNIDEASGLAESKLNPDRIWVEQDSGNPAELAVIDTQGTFIKKIYVSGATNRDWEDIAVAAGPQAGKSYIYVAETGDNSQNNSSYAFYRFVEPSVNVDTIKDVDKLSFIYPDGSHDVEGFIVNPDTKDIYLFTKRDVKSRVYKLAYPQKTDNVNVATFVGELPFAGVTSAAISDNGLEIILKTYSTLYYWKRNSDETPEALFARTATILGYQMEQQGEAITFKLDNSGFYTLSERPMVNPVNLNFYKRK